MGIDVREEPATKTLWRLSIYDGDKLIGEYERSARHQIARKKQEVINAKEILRNVYEEYGYFCVRWDGNRRVKSVRVDGTEVRTIPEHIYNRSSAY